MCLGHESQCSDLQYIKAYAWQMIVSNFLRAFRRASSSSFYRFLPVKDKYNIIFQFRVTVLLFHNTVRVTSFYLLMVEEVVGVAEEVYIGSLVSSFFDQTRLCPLC